MINENIMLLIIIVYACCFPLFCDDDFIVKSILNCFVCRNIKYKYKMLIFLNIPYWVLHDKLC